MKRKPSRDLKIILIEPKGGCDQKRLSMALRMLISEKDVVEYFRQKHPPNSDAARDSKPLKQRSFNRF